MHPASHIHEIYIVTRVLLALACILATAFPIYYSCTRWRQTRLGQALMAHALGYAATLDTTFVYSFAVPDSLLVYRVINLLVIGFVLVGAISLPMMLYYYRHYQHKPIEAREDLHGKAFES